MIQRWIEEGNAMPRTNVFISYRHRGERWRHRVVDHVLSKKWHRHIQAASR